VPRGAEHVKNDAAVKATLAGAQAVPVAELAGSIPQSSSPRFDLAFTPGTDQLTVGRFDREGEQVYLLVNREQKGISAEVKGNSRVKVLDPSTGGIEEVALPARLPIQANRALMLIPRSD
jgi:hypothetical protein